MEFVKVWFDALSGQAKILLAIAVTAILLGMGVYDNRLQTQQNRQDIEEVKDSLQKLNQGLESLGKDTGDILCLLIQDEADDPLVCIEERRFGDLLRGNR